MIVSQRASTHWDEAKGKGIYHMYSRIQVVLIGNYSQQWHADSNYACQFYRDI